MKICSLASGSSGNCTYIETDNYKLLIDIGKNKKYIVNKLAEIGVNYKDIDYVFLTHSHDDHTAALKTFLKDHKAVLVVTKEIFMELKNASELEYVYIYDGEIEIPGLNIKSYKMSHDVADIRAFVIEENNEKIVYITDTGYINSRYFRHFYNATAFFIESNHDIEKLRHGPYPIWLQNRVLSDVGHLSNIFTGSYLEKMIGPKTKHILLLHLSEKNNSEELALSTIKEHIDNLDYQVESLDCAKANEISKVYEI